MLILFDFRCTVCHGAFEDMVPSREVDNQKCPACGGPAKKVMSPVGLLGPGRRAMRQSTLPTGQSQRCADNRDVPGLCNLSPEASAVWVAKARGDGRALEAAYRHQEALVSAGHTLTATSSHVGAVSHS